MGSFENQNGYGYGFFNKDTCYSEKLLLGSKIEKLCLRPFLKFMIFPLQ